VNFNQIIQTLINLALKKRLLVVSFMLGLIAAGLLAYQNLSMQAYPDFTSPMVRVITLMPGKGAEEVERLVTLPLEKELNGLPGEVSLRSQSIFGLSVIKIVFEDGVSTQMARQQVLERIHQADLPDDVNPELDPDASPIGEIYRYTVDSKYYNAMSLKATEDWQLEKLFRQIPGVVDVTSFGGPTKTYQVNIDPGRLKALNLSVVQVFDAIAKSNATTGGNYIENNGQAYIVRGLGLLSSVADLENVVISAQEDGTPIRVRDVARITIGPGLRLGQVGKNDSDDVVQGIVLMRRGQDPSRVIERLYDKFPQLQAALPDGIRLVPLYDRMELVRRTMETISHSVAEGIVLVVAVLILFMFEVRSALIAAVVIPLSLLVAFILLNVFHVPANLLSMGAVDFGILVDSTVVMVENIHRRLAHEGRGLSADDRVHLVGTAAKEVSKPIFFATVIIATAFLPVFAFSGVAGKLFHPLAFTMNFALLGSVLVAMTIIPVLCSFFLTKKPIVERESPVFRWFEKIYRPALRFSLRRPLALLGGVGLAVLLAAGIFFNLGTEFLPKLDEGNIWLRVTVLPTSVALEKSVEIARSVRQNLLRYPEVKNVVSQIGSPDDGTDANPPSNIEFLVDLKPAKEWRSQWGENKEKLVESMDKALDVIPGIQTTFSQYIQDNVDEAIAGAKGEVAVKVYGTDLTVLQRFGDEISAKLQKIPGMVDVAADQLLGQPQYRIEIDRDAAVRYGINVEDLNRIIEVAIGGKVATQMVEDDRKFNVVVRFDKAYRTSLEALSDLMIPTPDGRVVPLLQVARLVTSQGATTILHSDNSRLITVKANVRGRDLGGAVQEAQQVINQSIHLPPFYRLVWGGQYENQQEANTRLQIAVPITLIAIYILLYLPFGKHRDALISMSAVPLAFLGGTIALALTHTYFSVSAGVGLIAAIGVSVQNAVIVVSSVRENRRQGMNKHRAILIATQNRLKPVLMAGTVAILGLIPAALSNGIGSQSQKPFAIVIIGALCVSTMMTLLVIPALYVLVEDLMPNRAFLFNKRVRDRFIPNDSRLIYQDEPRDPRTPRSLSGNLLSYLLLLGVLAVTSLAGCGEPSTKIPEVPERSGLQSAPSEAIVLTPAQEKTIGLRLEQVRQAPFPINVSLTGEVQAINDKLAHVFSTVTGPVISVSAKLGDVVRQGQALCQIKSDQVGQLQADLMQEILEVDAEIRAAQVQSRLSQSVYQREMTLYRDKVSARADMEAALAQYEKDRATLVSLAAKRQATIQAYQERLSLYGVGGGVAQEVVRSHRLSPYVTLRAPRTGLVIARDINTGELAEPSHELFSLADLSEVWVVGNVYEKDIPKIQLGQPVAITVDSLGDQVFNGHVTYIGSILNPNTRTMDIRIQVANAAQQLKPNMFARMKIRTGYRDSLVVPASAIQHAGDYAFAYVPLAPHRYEERRVEVGLTEEGQTQLLSGLTAGQQIVTEGTLALKGEVLNK
jgi:cobalt-zinc-cadmium resistance protein CzcA